MYPNLKVKILSFQSRLIEAVDIHAERTHAKTAMHQTKAASGPHRKEDRGKMLQCWMITRHVWNIGPVQYRIIIAMGQRSEEHTSELQSRENLVCRLLLEKKKIIGPRRSVDVARDGA